MAADRFSQAQQKWFARNGYIYLFSADCNHFEQIRRCKLCYRDLVLSPAIPETLTFHLHALDLCCANILPNNLLSHKFGERSFTRIGSLEDNLADGMWNKSKDLSRAAEFLYCPSCSMTNETAMKSIGIEECFSRERSRLFAGRPFRLRSRTILKVKTFCKTRKWEKFHSGLDRIQYCARVLY